MYRSMGGYRPPSGARLDQLVTTKRTLDLEALLEEISSPSTATCLRTSFPGVGELYLEDGLHRALRAALQQRQTMHARVLRSQPSGRDRLRRGQRRGVSTVIGRIFRIVRTPITLLLLLGVLVLCGLVGIYQTYCGLFHPPPAQPCVDQSINKGQLKSSQVTVKVYNGGNKRGLAGDVGRELRDQGFNVIRTTNTAGEISRTVIVGAEAKNPEVLLVQSFFKNAVVKGDKRVDRTVDVLVGNKYAGFNKDAKRTYTVDAKTLCYIVPEQYRLCAPWRFDPPSRPMLTWGSASGQAGRRGRPPEHAFRRDHAAPMESQSTTRHRSRRAPVA